ncbi:hypothetical protein [Microbacterium halotolerans]|uniref:hypothetical protein n=1 Tax=Microbacterium halotolerans TaxID=246613 RepID=UPI0013C2FDC2|nr:hypothetical protein [Microbacterium halotolerans]
MPARTRWGRFFVAAALAMGAALTLSAPASAAGITPKMPDGVVPSPDGIESFLVPNDVDAESSIKFAADLDVAESDLPIRVDAVAMLPDGTEQTLCGDERSDWQDFGPDPYPWLCFFSAADSNLPTATAVQVRLTTNYDADDAAPPTAVAAYPEMSILAPPEYTDSDGAELRYPEFQTDTGTLTVSGTKEPDLGITVHDGRILDRDDESGEPLCVDLTPGTREWSCELTLPDDTVDTHLISARQVPISAGDSPFSVTSGYRWAVVERLAPTDPDPTDPDPTDPVDPEPTDPDPTDPLDPEPTEPTDPDPTDPVQDPTPDPDPTTQPVPEPSSPSDPVGEPDGPTLEEPDPELASSDDDPAQNPILDADDGDRPAQDAPIEQDPDDADEERPAPVDTPPPVTADAATTVPPAAASDEPTEYGHGLPTFGDLLAKPIGVVIPAVATAIGFLILVAIPSELMYGTLRQNYTRLAFAPAALRRRWAAWRARRSPRWRVLVAPAIITTGALIASFADPAPPAPGAALRLFLALMCSMTLMNVLAVMSGRWAAGRMGLPTRVLLMPGFLLIGAVGVLASRIFDMHPGILFGILAMSVVTAAVKKSQAGVLALILCGGFIVAGVVAWLMYAVIGDSLSGFWGEFLRELLTAVAAGGIGSMVVVLLPVTFMSGRDIFLWSKRVWALVYAIALVLFVLLVVPLPDSWQESAGTSLLWLAAFGAFGAVSIGVWAWFRFRAPAKANAGNLES